MLSLFLFTKHLFCCFVLKRKLFENKNPHKPLSYKQQTLKQVTLYLRFYSYNQIN